MNEQFSEITKFSDYNENTIQKITKEVFELNNRLKEAKK